MHRRLSLLVVVVGLLSACEGSGLDPAASTAEVHVRRSKRCVNLRGDAQVADTMISAAAPWVNHGGAATLTAGLGNALPEDALVRFDLSAIPHGATTAITSAELKLTRASDDAVGVLAIHRVTAAWSESVVTWNSFGQAFDPAVQGVVADAPKHVRVSLTDLVAAWVHGAPNHGILIGRTDPLGYPDGVELFDSAEGRSPAAGPELRVCYEDTCTPGAAGCALCDTTCSLANADAACVDGVCQLAACQAWFGDCNENPTDGCEVDLTGDTQNCGLCGSACGAGADCTAGVCVYPACDASVFDCDRDPADGCDASPCVPSGYCVTSADCTGGACVDGFCAPDASYVHTWSATGSMYYDPRDYATAVVLGDGRVLSIGGVIGFTAVGSSEIFDPATGAWTPVNGMRTPRVFHTATYIPWVDIVVVTGGLDVLGGTPVDTIEFYSLSDKMWFDLPAVLSEGRWLHTATYLENGDVLIAGGLRADGTVSDQVEVFRYPNITVGPAMNSPHSHHTATRLQDGRVLVAGGRGVGFPGTTAAAEVYDPVAGGWTTTGSMAQARYFHAASLLGDGRVLVTGGNFEVGDGFDTTEIYDPATELWTPSMPMTQVRYRHTSTRLANGKILVVGGGFGGISPLSSAEIFEPSTEVWSPTASMSHSRYQHAAVALPNGWVVVVGGSGLTPGAERFTLVGPNGAACSTDPDCEGGHCVDGVCCDSACAGGTGDCQACSVAAGASSDGTCSPLTGSACEDTSPCTSAGVCSAGTCVPGGTIPCAALPDGCYDAGVCLEFDGSCSYAFNDGPACASTAPDLDAYLAAHTNVANAIKWQFRQTSACCAAAADAGDLLAWPAWSEAEKDELRVAFRSAWHWYFDSASPFADLREYLIDPPVNISDPARMATDHLGVETRLSESDARQLYIAWVAHSLFVELANLVAWRLADYDDLRLLLLLDSATMLRRSYDGDYLLQEFDREFGGYSGAVGAAPPRYTYAFMLSAGIPAATQHDTVINTLEWSRNNHRHFLSWLSNGVADATWQYRGTPPFSRVVEGTVNSLATNPQFGHWTAGCHGTTGFLKTALRSVNIPVQGVMYVCSDTPFSHHQVYFPTEDAYLDHGDAPYDQDFKASSYSADVLLVDRATYLTWNNDQDGLNSHVYGPCSNVNRRVNELFGP